eukprot:scaffold46909_cov51-Phaeocystis_antarctica.AAC.2
MVRCGHGKMWPWQGGRLLGVEQEGERQHELDQACARGGAAALPEQRLQQVPLGGVHVPRLEAPPRDEGGNELGHVLRVQRARRDARRRGELGQRGHGALLRREAARGGRRHGGEAHQGAIGRVALRRRDAERAGAAHERLEQPAQPQLRGRVGSRALLLGLRGGHAEGRVGHRREERGQVRLQRLGGGPAEQRVEQREAEAAPRHRRVAALRLRHRELLEHEGEVDSHVAAGARQRDAAAHLPPHVVVLVLDRLEQRGEQRLGVRGDRRPGQPQQPEERVGRAQPALDLVRGRDWG